MKRSALLFLLLLLPVAADDQITRTSVLQEAAVSREAIIISNFINSGGESDSASPTHPAPPPGFATLRWKNGESVYGNIASASENDVTWKTPLFDDPLQLRWNVIDRVEWPAAAAPPGEPFSIALRDGSFIFGNIVSVGADSISIHSARHGDSVLKRSEVLNARRLPHGDLLYSGPLGVVGWTAMSSQQDGNMTTNVFYREFAPPLATGPDGALLIRAWNRGAARDTTFKLPDRVDIVLGLHSSKRPQFSLALGGSLRESLRLETWDDVLVLAKNTQFKIIRKIYDTDRNVNLRICWDKKAQKCSVYSLAGDLIVEWKVPGDASSGGPGLILDNKGLDLSLDLLRIRAWDGKSPAKIDLNQPGVELADGRYISGAISGGATGSIHVQSAGQAAADFPLANVDALMFSSGLPQVASHQATLLFNDGAIIFGNIASIADGRATLATSFATQPFSAKLDAPRQLLIRSLAPADKALDKPLAEQDQIVVEQTTLHGSLRSAGDDSPGWIPVGGLNAARPSKSFSSTITRFIPPDAPMPADPALFYLSSGDVLPGSLGSLDRSGAEFESSLMAPRKLAANELNAIKFGLATRLNIKGFRDSGWQIVKGDEKTVRRKDDGIQMDAGTSIAYPSLMQSSEISFKYASNGFSSARLRMFCSRTDSSKATNLLLGNTGNQFISGVESTEGQFDNQVQVKTQPGEPVAVRLKIEPDEVELFVNGVSVQHIPVEEARRAGSGLIIEPASLWGNGVFSLSLSDFSATSGPGAGWLPDIGDDIRTQVLTVPRFQKDDPPRHLLLGPNGDVLRGEVEAATATHFGFRSGLENLDVPRDRVTALIWLKPPDANAPAVTESPATNVLEHRISTRMMFGGAGLSQLTSFIESQDSGLKIKLPDKEDPRRIQMQFNNQTVGQAIEMLCSRFDLRFRTGTDGTIVLEPATLPLAAGLQAKTFWLKPDAMPKTPSVQEVLTGRGITFPAGSSVQWQPQGGLLSVINTPDNQDKLAALLKSDFGGSLGSPTHWVELIGGGRLGFAVDKMGQDFITGHHPVYGAIKVPMAQVYVIRNSAPPPTVTIKSLENWQLVNAPEPVIPDSGGESSPLLGKDASTFKLSLLEGGDFDLAAQKGQIVVLDFWATWCGPCIKSLPGLIEAMSSFPSDRVKLVGVNQGESPDQVKHFLETRNLKLTVAMDADQSVAQKYGVDAIPHTVIVGPDGKVAWVQTGYNPDGETEASDTVKRLLGPPSPAKSASDHL